MTSDENKINNNEQTERIVERIETPYRITKETLVPIGAIVIVAAVCIWVGALADQVSAINIKDSPSRAEFNSICDRLDSIDGSLKNINQNILNIAQSGK